MADLIDEQLAFERLKRFTPFISDERLNLPPALDAARPQAEAKSQILTKSSLGKSYEDIEKYLNHVIDEYQDKRNTVRDELSASLAGFDKLSGFIGDDFTACVSNQMDDIIKTLLEALWQPLDSPV
jgi:hypothetical protein